MKNEPNIAVGVMSATELQFDLMGKYELNDVPEVWMGECTAKLKGNTMSLSVNGQTVEGLTEATFIPTSFSADNFELFDVTIGVNFHWEQKENQKFQGGLKLIIEDDKITAVNVLPLESYLISVISSEMKADSSLELLKAHAVISRSWLMAQIVKQNELASAKTEYQSTVATNTEYIKWYDREDHTNFHVCADDHCQRYQGVTRANNPNVVKAVSQTAGMVLMSEGKIADARFSKCCGGISELFENCWEPIHYSYLEAVIDNPTPPKGFETDLRLENNAVAFINGEPEAFCNTKDEVVLKQVLNDYDFDLKEFYRWGVTYTQKELSELILKRSGNDFGTITDMIPMERGTSGRLIKLKIVGSKKTLTVGKELEIRRWLSKSHLYSSAFVVSKQMGADGVPTSFTLRGSGWGHGAGLCQIGAAVMGHKGYTHDQILFHYFKNTTLESAY